MFNIFKNFLKNLIPIKSLHIAYDSGERDLPVVVMIHGIAATSKTWDPLVKELQGKYRLICLDILGFGKSPKPVVCEYGVDDHVQYIQKTLNKMRLKKPFIIIGHSMGSIIAVRYAIKNPKTVKKLFLMSPPIYHLDGKGQTIFARKQTDAYMNAYDFLTKNKEFTIKHSGRLRKFFNVNDGIEVTNENWNAFRLSLQNTIINQNIFEDIKNTKIPISIIYGALDEFLISESVNLLSDFKNVTITKITTVDHAVSGRFAREVAKQINA